MENNFLKNIKTLDKNKKENFISQIFSNVSKQYDFMNDLMSLGLHRTWKEKLIEIMDINNDSIILDLASGSGDLTKIVKKKFSCDCIVFDSNLEMINQAKTKLQDFKIKYINGNAESLPFKKNFFDHVMVSFGLRNFTDIERSLNEVHRILRKNGKFFCMEFSEINNVMLRKIFFLYSKIIPKYGKFFSNNEVAYEYLIESIRNFPNQIQLTKKLKKAGFERIEVIDIMGGLASIHISEKK